MLRGLTCQDKTIMARDVCKWLENLGLGKYVESFVANDVDLVYGH